MIYVNDFYVPVLTTNNKFSIGSTKNEKFPITPIVKIAHFWQCHVDSMYDVSKSERFLQWGSMGKVYVFCRIQLKFNP